MATLVDGIIATGAGAFRPGRELTGSEPPAMDASEPQEHTGTSPSADANEYIHPALRDTTMSEDEVSLFFSQIETFRMTDEIAIGS